MWTLWRIGGSVVSVVIVMSGLLGLVDVPDQLAKLKGYWDSAVPAVRVDWGAFWSGSGGRSLIVCLGVAIGLWAWDVPQRLWRLYVRRDSPDETTKKEEYTELDVTQQIKNDVAAAQALRDLPSVRKELEHQMCEVERIRGELGRTNDALTTCKRDFAISRIEWFAQRAQRSMAQFENRRRVLADLPDIHVTVRFAVYADYDLAKRIEAILKEHTKWHVNFDGSNNPVITPMKDHKVIFESGISHEFDEIASAFADGELVPGPIWRRAADRPTDNHLVVEVAPVKL